MIDAATFSVIRRFDLPLLIFAPIRHAIADAAFDSHARLRLRLIDFTLMLSPAPMPALLFMPPMLLRRYAMPLSAICYFSRVVR